MDRVLSFSTVVGIGTPPPPHPQASVFPPPLVRGGGGGMGRCRKRLAVCKKEVKMDGFAVDSWYNRDKRSGMRFWTEKRYQK